jgi:N-6 DNA Methylase
MLTPSRVRSAAALDLFRELGYPIEPIDVDPDEWRRGGVAIPWNGDASLRLAARLRRFDLFHLRGTVAEESIAQFLRSYREYNQLTKSVLIYEHDRRVSVFDAGERGVRRLDVDLDEPSPHAIDRLNLLKLDGDESVLPRIFDRALDRESVSRQFFQRFRAAVHDVSAALAEECPNETQEARDAEGLLILSRLLFLSFVQEKGWLNGERRFLVDRLERCIAKKRDFFTTIIVPLFFDCLNTPAADRTAAARKLGRIPYLNGGLFEPAPFERRNDDFRLSNELMQRVIEDVFEKFDFSIDENDPAGTRVDPEMLGKVFESLMAEDERAASGSFYTAKEIVDVLTERAIVEWLGDGPAEATIEKLERITVLDPACGSGAFLLSALGVIEKLYRARGVEPCRQKIVERSLFGVDLKPEAVRLCELRLWLAIVAGSGADIDDVPPLPNLDRNILQGNSLLGPADFLGAARADLYAEWRLSIRAQEDLIERYRSSPRGQKPILARIIRGNDLRFATELLTKAVEHLERELQEAITPQKDLFQRAVPVDHERCRELQRRIAEYQDDLHRVEEGSLDFFSFDIHFAHVMANGGFDVVAGNPPWVRNSRIDPRAKRMLTERYALFRAHRNATAFHQPDLSVAFFERSLALAAPDGVIALLMPAKIANAAYAAPLRRAAIGGVVAIDDWSDRKLFDADTFPMGLCVAPSASAAVSVTAGGEAFTLSREQLSTSTGEWSLVPPAVASLLSRLRRDHRPLDEVLGRKPLMGVKTGDNRSFFVTDEERRELRIPLTALCRCVRGRDVRRWSASESQWMLWPPAGGWKKAPRWLEKFAETRKIDADALRLAFVRPEHVGIKVVWKDLSRGMSAAVLPDVVHIDEQPVPLVPNQTLYLIDAVSLDEAYAIAAVLNSIAADALLLSVAERAKDAHFRYFGRTVARLPWPVIDNPTALVRAARRRDQDAVDHAVARLYGVTDAELAVLRAFVERRLGAR